MSHSGAVMRSTSWAGRERWRDSLPDRELEGGVGGRRVSGCRDHLARSHDPLPLAITELETLADGARRILEQPAGEEATVIRATYALAAARSLANIGVCALRDEASCTQGGPARDDQRRVSRR